MAVPLLLLALCAIAYGGWIPRLGFYWDDWPYLWVGHLSGPGGYPAFVASDRPFSAWIFMLEFALFGEQPLGYHLLALVLRWAGAAGFWWTMRQVWPGRRAGALSAAVLFAIYPGFGQQPIALIYNHHFSILALFMFSLGGMVWAARRPGGSTAVTLLSLGGAAGMFSLEYFVGLELLRPLLLWIALDRPGIRKILRVWAPYAVLLAAFVFWRVVIFRFPSYQPEMVEKLSQPGLAGLLEQARVILQDQIEAAWLAWGRVWPGVWADAGWSAFLAAGLAAGLVAAAVFVLYRRGEGFEPGTQRWIWEILLLGAAAVILAGWPYWITNLELRLDGMRDRLTLAFLPGAALLLTWLVESIGRRRVVKTLLLAVLAGGSAGWHAHNAQEYVRSWEQLRDFYWQLTWRAPGLQPGTSLLANDLPIPFFSDNSLTAPLNWTYAPAFSGPQMPYLLDFISVRLGRGLSALEPGAPVSQDYRSLHFASTTRQSIALYYQPPGCLRLLDPLYEQPPAGSAEELFQAAAISRLDQVFSTNPPARPPELLGPEPGHGWCFFYQKASLARQLGDWQTAARLGDEALASGAMPGDPSEWAVFVEAQAQTGNLERAEQISRLAAAGGPSAGPAVCAAWTRFARSQPPDPDLDARLDALEVSLGCDSGE